MTAAPAQIPAVGRPKPLKVPAAQERTLRNGLRVVAIKRSTVPRAEIRLRVPAGGVHDTGDGARARLLPETLLGGAGDRDAVAIARELQRLGGSLDAGTDSDDLLIRGGVLAGNLSGLLALLADVLHAPSFPADEVAVARDRVAQEIIIQRSQPGALAGEALRARLFGSHRYGRPIPDPEAIRRIGRAPVLRFFEQRVLPKGSSLVVVGDLAPTKALDAVEEALGRWRGTSQGQQPPAPPRASTGRSTVLVARAGAVQTTIRVGGPALSRRDEGFFPLALAVMVFGGYFSSRLVKNIREDKGYTYSPNTMMDHKRAASSLIVNADVGTEVTAAALLEIRYELGRMAALPVPQEELDQARRYLAGATGLSIQTLGGLASYVDGLLASGVGLDFLRDFRRNLEAVTTDDVQAAGIAHLAPRHLQTVLVGDPEAITPTVGAFDALEQR